MSHERATKRTKTPGAMNKPYVESEVEKVYWTTPELCKMLNEKTGNIINWCANFGIEPIRPYKEIRRHGLRFTAKQVEKIREIHRLLKVELYTIEGARKKLARG